MSQISDRLALLRLFNSFSENAPSWESPEASIGDFCRTMGRNQCWHARGPARDLFVRLAEEVKTYLNRNCEPPSRELHWSLYMIGRTKSTARPVLMFICEDSSSRKTARKTIKESGILLRYPGVDTADCSYPPDFGQLVQLASGEYEDDSVMKESNSETLVFYRLTKRILGSDVFAERPLEAGKTSRKAKVGMVVKLEDKICFLTAAHVFAPQRPSSVPFLPFEYDIDGDSDSGGEEFLQTLRQGSRSPLSNNSDPGLEESKDSTPSQESELNVGETVTGRVTTNPTPTVEAISMIDDPGQPTHDARGFTQHALRPRRSRSSSRSRKETLSEIESYAADVASIIASARANSQDEKQSRSHHRRRSQSRGRDSTSRLKSRNKRMAAAYFPGAAARGLIERARSKSRSRSMSRTRRLVDLTAIARAIESPLESGTLLASSLQGSHPNLDYALIKIEGSHTSLSNRLFLNNGMQSSKLIRTRVASSVPKDAEIIAISGSSDNLSGRLLGTPCFSSAPGQPSQELWTVKFNSKLMEGVCGTCVFDARTDEWYGHVVAGNPDSGYAYIIPAYQVQDDLISHFGLDLQLYRTPLDVPYQHVSTFPERGRVESSTSQSVGPLWGSKHTTSDDSYGSAASKTDWNLTTNERLSRHVWNSPPSSFFKQTSDYFTPGKIFIVRWSDIDEQTSGKAQTGNSNNITGFNDPRIASPWRQLVVISTKRGLNYSTCVPMTTYDGQGLAKPGLDLWNHAVVFNENLTPYISPRELIVKREPLAVSLSEYARLDKMSRINFGEFLKVEHNVEVRHVGSIADSSMDKFKRYAAEALRLG